MPLRDVEFGWNSDKAKLNLKLHHVAFQEAASVFDDPYARIVDDEDHREIIIGYSERNRLLFVSFTVRDEIIRLISARLATQGEREEYQEHYRRLPSRRFERSIASALSD